MYKNTAMLKDKQPKCVQRMKPLSSIERVPDRAQIKCNVSNPPVFFLFPLRIVNTRHSPNHHAVAYGAWVLCGLWFVVCRVESKLDLAGRINFPLVVRLNHLANRHA